MEEPKPNLFTIARSNADSLEERLDCLIERLRGDDEEDGSQPLVEFVGWFRRKVRISINMRLPVFLRFARKGTYLNAHALARELADRSGRPKDELLRERLGPYYDRRMAFDEAFEDGDRFVFAAVNCGNAGFRSKFGGLCAEFHEELPSEDDGVAYFPEDTLSCCFAESGDLDLAEACTLAAPHAQRHCVAALKLVDEVIEAPETEWPSLVLSDSSYIEAILGEAPSYSWVAVVRIPQAEYDRLKSLTFDDLGCRRSVEESALMVDFLDLLEAVEERRLYLEIVP